MLERYGDNYYYYNEEGIRIAKEENGLIHKYYVEDNVIHKEEIRNKSNNQLVKEIYYYYDETGISAFRINSNIYYYLKDLTGLILGIYNSDGVIIARMHFKIIKYIMALIIQIQLFIYRNHQFV